MSLVGNLEDLSLPDILQIVSLSQKSGILTIEQEGRQGKIFIRAGRVIQTVSPRTGKTLGEILTGKGLVQPDALNRALEAQRDGAKKELLGSILVGMGVIEQDALEKVVQKQIEESIVYFLTWREGTFSFELCDIESRGEVSVDPHAFILERGIDTQWLVLEGTRLMDERKKSGTLYEDHPEPAAADGGGGAGGVAESAVIIVDDDSVFLTRLAERITGLGYAVTPCENAAEALEALEGAPSDQAPPAVVTDIVYPTSDGTGFLGGLELIERVRNEHPEAAVIAITAYPDDNVKNKVGELGVGEFLIKPTAGSDDEEVFFDQLTKAIGAAPGKAPALQPPPAEASDESGEETLAAAVPATAPAAEVPGAGVGETLGDAISEKEAEIAQVVTNIEVAGLDKDQMSLLQDMMVELQGPNAASEIGLLILRFAAEVLNRAVLFMIKGGAAVGLGGFGIDVTAGGRKGGVKGIKIPLEEDSFLGETVKNKAPVRGPVADTPWNEKLMKDLGGETPGESVAIPLVASGKVRVVLYGDNLPEKGPLPNTQALEIFLAQAGLTLERVFLERQLQQGGSS